MSLLQLTYIHYNLQTLCKVDTYIANTIDIINNGHMYSMHPQTVH